ncbi:MAG: DUF58 domain-containing protein [Treponema sp.]|nr:DUF58 domain-containing protein [Treponema sp.]
MLDDETLVKKASYLRIAAHDLAEGMKTGSFRSLYRGQGIEFAGVRDYIRGDDIRSIDWNVTARMGRPYVKLFEEERELQIFLILDTSLSMTAGQDKRKFSKAIEAAALLTIAAELNACPIGAIFFDSQINFTCEPKTGRNQTLHILTELDKLEESKKIGTVLPNAITGASKILRKRSLVFIISDFRVADWEKAAITLAEKNDIIALRLTEDYEKEIPEIGTISFKDAESKLTMMLPSSNPRFQKEWKKQQEANENKWRTFCLKHGIYPAIMKSQDEVINILNEIFSRKAGTK